MISPPRRSLLGLIFGAAALGCSGERSRVALSAPLTLPPPQHIPIDLDVVVRLDIERIRRNLDTDIAEALARLLVSPASAPGELLLLAITHSEKIWLGFRPDLDPRCWDNVVILEGDFSTISTDSISNVWGPSRDLGGGYKVYDIFSPQGRTKPARLYTLHEERWLIASEAEVDALERSVELGRSERQEQPPARGLVSVTARLGRLTEIGGNRAALRAFEKARSFEAWFDVSDRRIILSARVKFAEEADATLAHRALSLLAALALPEDIEWNGETSGMHLSIDASAPLELLRGVLAG